MRRNLMWVLVTALTLAMGLVLNHAPAKADGGAAASVTGKIVQGDDAGTPAADVKVLLRQKEQTLATATTDAEGKFTLTPDKLADGDYIVVARADGKVAYTKITVQDGKQNRADLKLVLKAVAPQSGVNAR